MKKGKIILLNGVSSAGKSTLTKALQRKLDIPYYHICCDDFMNMTPKHILDRDFDNQLNITQSIMQEVVALYSDKGHNVIVDDVIIADVVSDIPKKNKWLYLYLTLLNEYPVLFVKVDCPIEELERREIARGDRCIGQSRFQLERMDTTLVYDLIVNTYQNTTEECAEAIIRMLDKQDDWDAFNKMYNRLCK